MRRGSLADPLVMVTSPAERYTAPPITVIPVLALVEGPIYTKESLWSRQCNLPREARDICGFPSFKGYITDRGVDLSQEA